MANNKITYTAEILEQAVRSSTTIAEVMRKLGIKPAGGSHAHLRKRIQQYGLDTTHFVGRGWNVLGRLTGGPARRGAKEILKINQSTAPPEKTWLLRRALLEIGRDNKCAVCGLDGTWNQQPLVLQIDHINGNRQDNRAENLRFLCPNCHSQTPTYNRPK